MTKEQINQLEVEFEVVKVKLEIAQQLITHEGFYKFWFEQLGHKNNQNRTRTEVFEKVNYLYQVIFKLSKGRYSSYDSFSKTASRIRNKRR